VPCEMRVAFCDLAPNLDLEIYDDEAKAQSVFRIRRRALPVYPTLEKEQTLEKRMTFDDWWDDEGRGLGDLTREQVAEVAWNSARDRSPRTMCGAAVKSRLAEICGLLEKILAKRTFDHVLENQVYERFGDLEVIRPAAGTPLEL